MRAEDDILGPQMVAYRTGDRFFTNVRMARAMDESPLMTPCEFLFSLPNDLHRSVKAK